MKNDYVSIIYNTKRTPTTDYPAKLTKYLFDRFKMNKGKKLLEIGCGRGEYLMSFQELGLDCEGVDLSDTFINDAGLKGVLIDISKERLPFEDNSFDVVYHKSLLEHLYSPDNLMKESYRVLKPGGRVIILTPDWQSVMRVFYEDITHNKPYDLMAILDLLRIYGFSEVKSELFYQLPIIWEYPFLRGLSYCLRIFIPTPMARKLTQMTGIKFFRWSVELMVLGTGTK